MATPAKRMRYTASFKLNVVAYANASNNRAASKQFEVNEKLVREWKKCADLLEKLPKNKCALRGSLCHWPKLEDDLEDWINENRLNGLRITRTNIRCQALEWAKTHPEESKDFKGTMTWCTRFMKRKNLMVKQRSEAEKFEDVEEEIVNSDEHVFAMTKQLGSTGYPLHQFDNKDRVYGDMPKLQFENYHTQKEHPLIQEASTDAAEVLEAVVCYNTKQKAEEIMSNSIVSSSSSTSSSDIDSDEMFFLTIASEIRDWNPRKKSELKLAIRSLMHFISFNNE